MEGVPYPTANGVSVDTSSQCRGEGGRREEEGGKEGGRGGRRREGGEGGGGREEGTFIFVCKCTHTRSGLCAYVLICMFMCTHVCGGCMCACT